MRLKGQYMEGYTGVVVTTNRVLRTAKVRLDPPLKVLGLHKSVLVSMGNIRDNYGPVVKPPPRG